MNFAGKNAPVLVALYQTETEAPEEWAVEVINRAGDGGVEIALFSGGWTKARAMRHVETEYGAKPDLAGGKTFWREEIPAGEFSKGRR